MKPAYAIEQLKKHVESKREHDRQMFETMFLIGTIANTIDSIPDRHVANSIGLPHLALRQAKHVAKKYGTLPKAEKALQASTRAFTWHNLVALSQERKDAKKALPATMRKLYEKTTTLLNANSPMDDRTRESAMLLRKLIDKHFSEDIDDPLAL